VKRFVSITVLLVFAGLSLAAPLFACGMSCCGCGNGRSCDPTFRPAMTCCKVDALPNSTTPAKLAVSPMLPALAHAEIAVQAVAVIGTALFPEVTFASHIAFPQAPLRI